jgi:hypothetical protein
MCRDHIDQLLINDKSLNHSSLIVNYRSVIVSLVFHSNKVTLHGYFMILLGVVL